MQKLITASLAAAALVAALSSIADAAPATLRVPPGGRGTHDHVGISITTPPAPAPDESGIDRTFHPDYSQALRAEQMAISWNAEIDRVFQTPIAGGG